MTFNVAAPAQLNFNLTQLENMCNSSKDVKVAMKC